RAIFKGEQMNKLEIKLRWFDRAQLAAFFTALALSFATVCNAEESPHSPGWVVLPIEDYRSLHTRAYPPDHEPEPPSVDATLTRVDYDLRIGNEVATGKASLTVDVLKDGWVRVPIPPGLLVREAELDGKPVALASDKGKMSALLSHAGRAVLTLTVVLPVS